MAAMHVLPAMHVLQSIHFPQLAAAAPLHPEACDASSFKIDLGSTRCPGLPKQEGIASAAECLQACCKAGTGACSAWQWCEPGKACAQSFWAETGAFYAGSDLDGWPQIANLSVAEAACSKSASCVGITYHSTQLHPTVPLKIYLKKAGAGLDNDPGWSRHVRASSGCYMGAVQDTSGCSNASEGWSAKAMAPLSDFYYTHFHAQPLKNWLNDPNGPMFFAGMYTLPMLRHQARPRRGYPHPMASTLLLSGFGRR